MATSKCKNLKKPSKPYPSYPLTAHNNGQWCKKICGRIHFFGVWEDAQVALERYLAVAAALHAGRQPSPEKLHPGEITVKDISNQYLTYQCEKVKTNDLRPRTFAEYRNIIECFAKFVGPTRVVLGLTPFDFQRFRNKLAQKGLQNNTHGLGVHALSRNITMLKSMFKYAYEMDIVDRPIKYGKAFDKPSLTKRRKSRQLIEQENGKRLFTPTEISGILEITHQPLHAMILLAVNGGFGNSDCSSLPISAIDFEQCLINFGRTKTGIERVVPLWPETVSAIKEALKQRPKPATTQAANLVFLTKSGNPWLHENIHLNAEGEIEKVISVDTLVVTLNKILKQLGIKRKGLGFYTLRHTFRTWADEVKDQHAIHRIMGHSIPGMSGIYVERISLDRLRAVVEHVRTKLFSDELQEDLGNTDGNCFT